jgi:PAS domain S-box-containing protein
MDARDQKVLTSVKEGGFGRHGSAFRHPAAIAVAAAALGALLVTNAIAFIRGMDAPWLLGSVIVSDIAVIGVGIFVAVREVLVAEQRTESSQAQLDSIVESATDAIITVDERQNIVLFNHAAEQVFRVRRAEAIGGPLERFLPERFRAAHRGHIERFGSTGVSGRRMGESPTLWGVRADGEEFPLEASISQMVQHGRRYFTVILRDVTLRRRAELEAERVRSALGDAQARLGAIVDSAMDAVITVDEKQNVVLFNRAAEQVFRVPRERALGMPLDRLIPQRFRGAHRGHVEAFGRTGVTSRRMGDVTTLWALRPDSGEEFPIEASISQAVEGERRYFTVILRDITVRKQAEDALRGSQRDLRELSARVLEAREEEKTRIARELHDELGQLLTALKMDLASMRERLPGELQGTANEMSALLDQTVAATRRISADLRPLMLDDLGLADAARWLAEDFANRSSIACRMEISGGDALESVSKSVSTAVYRAIQESLTNIARHAQARSAWATLAVAGDEILFEMEDDGRGIAPEDLAKARSLGLKGMRERIAHLGGSLEIARAPRGGTRLRVRVPLRGLAGSEEAA